MPPGQNVSWSAEGESGGGRDYEDIMLRRVPAAVAHRFRGAAEARGFTHAQYLTALVSLHEAMRKRAAVSGDNVECVRYQDSVDIYTREAYAR